MRAAEIDQATSLFGGIPYEEQQNSLITSESREAHHSLLDIENLVPQDLYSFAAGLERRMHACLFEELPQKAVAQEIILLLKEVVNQEVQCFELEDGLSIFDERMFGEPTLTSLIEKLYREARLVLYGGHSFSSPGLRSKGRLERAAEQFSEILRRYVRRKVSLYELANEKVYDELSTRLFGLKVKHDQFLFGNRGSNVRGLTLEFKACIIGSAFQTLWLRLLMRVDHEYVKTAEGWQSWSVAEDRFSGPLALSVGKIAATYPLSIDRQASIIDEGALFLPYEAMKLPQQKSEVEFELALFNQSGKKLAAHYLDNTVWMPARRRKPCKQALPSPHSLELWRLDMVSGDCVAKMQVKRRSLANKDENLLLDVDLDLTLIRREGQKIKISYRVLTCSGDQLPILSSNDSGFEKCGSMDVEILVQEQAAFYKGLAAQIPLAESAAEEELLLVEVVVQDSKRKIICGTYCLSE